MIIGAANVQVPNRVTPGNGVPASAPVQQSVSPDGPGSSPKFVSPVVRLDYDSGLAVLQYRSSETGEVRSQYPAKEVVRRYSERGGQQDDTGSSESSETASSESSERPPPASAPARASLASGPAATLG
jgi:hypothetical protein